MNREEKSLKIEELVQRFREYSNYYFTDASGLTVAEMVSFRKLCYERGVDYKVFKNSLIKKALQRLEAGVETWDREVLKGFTGIIFSRENGSAPARLLLDFRKKGIKKPILKAAFIDSELYVGDNSLDALTKIKSKNELIGEVIGLLQSPMRNIIAALQSSQDKLAGIVKTLSDKKE